MPWSSASFPFRGASKNFINQVALIVPANTVDTFMLPGIQPGPAEVFFGPYDISGKLNVGIRPVFNDGSIGAPIYYVQDSTQPSNTKSQVNAQIYLPNYRIKVDIINLDPAASHECDFSLWPVGGIW
jgi:hypothetical protein